VILGYFEDGPNLVTLAMNGWADGEPVWWLNLQAHPAARVDLADAHSTFMVRRRRARRRSVPGMSALEALCARRVAPAA
jgi:hypothetical protein